MAPPAVGLALDDAGALALEGPLLGPGKGFVDRHYVVAVYSLSGDAVGRTPDGDVLHGGGLPHGDGHAELVVFHHVDAGELPHGGHVDGLVEGALIAGPVAEEGHGHIGLFLHLQRQGAAGGDGDAPAHDGVGPQVPFGEVRDVHGAAAALAVAVGLAHQLRQGPVQLRALGDAVAVAPVGGGNEVLVRQLGANGCRHGLLAGVKVDGAPELVLREQGPRRLLEVPNLVHLVVDPKTGLFVDHRRDTSAFQDALILTYKL